MHEESHFRHIIYYDTRNHVSDTSYVMTCEQHEVGFCIFGKTCLVPAAWEGMLWRWKKRYNFAFLADSFMLLHTTILGEVGNGEKDLILHLFQA
jgi:hypothetical protein